MDHRTTEEERAWRSGHAGGVGGGYTYCPHMKPWNAHALHQLCDDRIQFFLYLPNIVWWSELNVGAGASGNHTRGYL